MLSSVRDTMYLGVAGACAEQEANASTPLKVTITAVDAVFIVVPPGSQGGSTNQGDITSVATATGGDGSYSYSWTLSEVDDAEQAFTINSQGTTTNATYNTATVSTNYNNQLPPPPPPPPPLSTYRVSCTVTDGTGATDTATEDFDVSVA